MRRGIVGLFVADAVSMLGSRMSMLALPWFVLITSGSAARTGLVAFVEMLPYVLVMAFGGPLLDRIGARRVSVLADLGSALTVAAIPLLYRGPGLPFEVLVALVAATGLLRGFGDSSKRVLLPPAVAASGMPMARATGIQDGINRLATLLGGPAAGVLIAVLDAPAVLLLDAASFAVAALLIGAFVPTATAPPRERYLAALRAGWRFVRGDRLILGIAVMLFVTNLLDAAHASVLAPVWGRDVAGTAAAVGIMWGIFGVGAVTGNAVFAVVAPRLPRYGTFLIGMLIGGAPRFFVPAVTDEVWPVYLVMLLSGFGIAGVNPVLAAVEYERVPETMQARVLGLTLAIAWGGIPLGGLLAGWAVSGLGLTSAWWLFGALYLAATVVPLFLPIWREMDRPTQDQGVPQVAMTT
ncbi:MFS transporter [Actinomycetes bacterium KLBMP 9797]